MASTAILTWAHQFSVQGLDANANLVGAAVLLQNQKTQPKKVRGKIDMTNCMSPAGKAEFCPGVLHGSFDIAGIVDAGNGYDTIFSYCMDGAFYAQSIFYLAKPTGINNPMKYTGVVLWTEGDLDWQTSAEGNCGKYTAHGEITGGLIKSGTDITFVTGSST